jgi:2-dehydropantoate 2-reductase
MRYVIIGAGAIGGTLGGRLAQHDPAHAPLLIARGDHGAAIARDGLRLRSPDDDTRVRVDTAATPEEVRLESDDVLVLATKTQAAETALREWVDRPVFAAGSPSPDPLGTAGDLLPVFTALNGIESERIASRLFARVFGVCVWLPAVHLTPGEIVIRIGPSSGTFIVGRFGPGADAADQTLLATLESDWSAAGIRMFVVDEVMPWKHRKLLSNLGNALQALLGPDADSGAIASRLRAEATELYDLAGVTIPTDDDETEWRGNAFDIRAVPGVEGDLGGSSWQSMKRGGSIESDYLNGEIALLARLLGRQAPLNASVQRLARQAAAAGAGAGSMTVAELETRLR